MLLKVVHAMIYLNIPLEFFIEIISRSTPTHLFGLVPESRMPDIPDFSPCILRYELGLLLKEKDPEENHVKVFLFPKSNHAEVWLRHEWEQSNSKYYRSRQKVQEEQERIWKISEAKSKISEFILEKMNIPKDQTAHKKLVDVLFELTTMPVSLDVIPGLRVLLQEVGNLKKD